MKHLLLTTIAAVVLVGCVTKQLQKTKAIPIQQPEPPTAKAPDISMLLAVAKGNIEAVKQHLAAGTDVNAKDKYGQTPLHRSAMGLSAIGPAQGSRRTTSRQRCRCECEGCFWQNTAGLLHLQVESKRTQRPPPQTRRQEG